jgi:hypothetical protein
MHIYAYFIWFLPFRIIILLPFRIFVTSCDAVLIPSYFGGMYLANLEYIPSSEVYSCLIIP